jgi:hypothetical protein
LLDGNEGIDVDTIREYLKIIEAAVKIQKNWRGYSTRKMIA